MNEAVKAISPQLDWEKQPSAHEKAIAFANEQDARMRRDFFASLQHQNVQKIAAKKADDVRELAAAKEIASLKGQIESVINNYVCGHHSGATNWPRTEAGHETMRKVLAKHTLNTVEDAKAALEAVRATKAKLP